MLSRHNKRAFLPLGSVLVVLLLFALGMIYPTFFQNAEPQPVGSSHQWILVFKDEFNSPTLDSQKWTTCYWWNNDGCTNASNHELEWYLPANITVKGGALNLTAQKETVQGSNGKTYPYTSGMITTGSKAEGTANPPLFAFTYGFVEARVWIPKGKGLWPAVWMLPASQNATPEIDLMEVLAGDPKTVYMNFHYSNSHGTSVESFGDWTSPRDLTTGWHTFGLDWEPDRIVWYIDGVQRREFTQKELIPNIPMYLLINLAVGGDWPGNPSPETPFPSTFKVDYVRIWKPGQVKLSPVTQLMNNASTGVHRIVNYVSNIRNLMGRFERFLNAHHG